MSSLNIAILGSTGSVGCQTLDVCRWFPQQLQVKALAAANNWQLLAAQAKEFKPQVIALANETYYPQLKQALQGLPLEITAGPEAAAAIAAYSQTRLIVAAMSGWAGLSPALAGINAGKDIALANKEILVAAGELVTNLAKEKGIRLLTVDSEHSAIYQCLQGEVKPASLIITASGGPFRQKSLAELKQVTAEQALEHPVWKMGRKITIDSASLANKGLEVIEAHWLFDMPYENIEVLVHPQGIVHSLVRFADGNIKAQLGPADMRLPIQYALLGPKRPPNPAPPLNLAAIGCLNFEQPDVNRFPALKLAYQAGRAGKSYAAAYNSANEFLGAAFLAGKIPFTAIGEGLETALNNHQPICITNVADVLEVDKATQKNLEGLI